MHFKVERMDARFKGYPIFKYRIKANLLKVHRKQFVAYTRKWCWETFGPGVELREWGFTMDFSRQWSWNEQFIYLKGDEELTLFNMRWSNGFSI